MANKYFEIARDDLDKSIILLNNSLLNNSVFQLAQSFEKANKSLLIPILQKQNQGIDEKLIEKAIHRIGHNKKDIINKILKYFKSSNSNNDLDTNILSKKIKSFDLFTNLSKLNIIAQKDLNIFNKIKGNNTLQDQELEYLRQKFAKHGIFQYKILTFILIRYFTDVENNLRYPTAKNNYSHDNYNNKNLSSIKILIQFNKELMEIIQDLRTNL
jgi:hypothetical protein